MSRLHRRAWPWVLLFTAIALVAVFYLAGGWYFSGQVYEDALKSEPYDPTDRQGGTVQAVEIAEGGGSITLLPDEADRADTSYDDAVVGLSVGESLVVAGPATRADDGSQTREVLSLVGEAPAPLSRYGLSRDVWSTPEEASLEYEDITLTTPAGEEYPAWLIPGKRATRWAVLAHGKGAARSEMLRMARPLHDSGYNVIVVTYQGDVGAPPYANGMVTYGRSEWPVIEAAVRYASDNGAKRIVLGGASHGGAVALGFLDRGQLASRVDGVILDAPAASLGDVIDEAAEFRSLPVTGWEIPESLEDAAKMIVAWRYGVDFGAIDYTDRSGLIEVPLLTLQGAADQTVPEAATDRFMLEGSGRTGQYEVVSDAGHVLAWNVAPERYEDAITEFLKTVEN